MTKIKFIYKVVILRIGLQQTHSQNVCINPNSGVSALEKLKEGSGENGLTWLT
jgi:hypothetical protein